MVSQAFATFFLIVLSFLLKESTATRIKDKIYVNIQGAAACFRRMNGTHQFGCASHLKGNVGVLQWLETADDLQWLLDKAEAGPYMTIMRPDMFNRNVMLSLKQSGKVSGAVLLRSNGSRVSHFSHEDTCPNRYSGLSSLESQTCVDTRPWNKDGTALMMVDWGFPIFYVSDNANANKILQCYSKYNSNHEGQRDRSLCAMEMQAFMFAAKDSETCIRRSNMITNLNPTRFCDPLGDRNIWSTVFPRSKIDSEKNRSMIVLTARLDATSMFDGVVPGAGSAVSGLVVALATAKLLADMREDMEPLRDGRNIMLALLNGEAYDYIGSSRMVYDMQEGQFPPNSTGLPPISLSALRMVVELNQLTKSNTSTEGVTTLFFHAAQENAVATVQEVSKFMQLMRTEGVKNNLTFETSSSSSLPPASLQSFLKGDPKMPGIVITDHGDQFSNRYYHSVLDDSALLGFTYLNESKADINSVQAYLARVSTTLARSIYQLTTGKEYSGSLSTDPMLVDELLNCYLGSMDCVLFRAATTGQRLPPEAPALYVGVSVGPNTVTELTGNLLALLTGTKKDIKKEQCHTNSSDLTFQYVWMLGYKANNSSGECRETTMNYSIAVSPAFEIEDYNWTSGQYSTWTESIWREFSVRIFLKPSWSHEAFSFSLGSVVLVISFIVIWFASSRSHVLFGNMLNGGC